jgi:hypothetical protein
MNSLNFLSGLNPKDPTSNNNRKNLYRTREHKNKSVSPTKKLSKITAPYVIASFRYALVSLYALLNRR